MTVNELLNQATLELQNVPTGMEFLVRDLFVGYKWKLIPLNDRLLLGSLFLNYAENAGSSIVKTTKKVSGQQRYEKL